MQIIYQKKNMKIKKY